MQFSDFIRAFRKDVARERIGHFVNFGKNSLDACEKNTYPNPASAIPAHRVTVMAFNAEDLFDTEDDPGNTGDDTYLPLAAKQATPDHESKCRANNDSDFYRRQCISLDWSEDVLTQKLNAFAAVLKSASPLPDIVIMPETENLVIVERLIEALPVDNRFPHIVQLDTTSVTEDRGIDVAILSRFALSQPATSHPIDFGSTKELCGGTRDIIEAPLALPDGKVLHVFGVHFPSGSNPLICRQHAAVELNRIRALLPADAIAITGGDFNFNCSESQGALFERFVRHGKWAVPPAMRAGCNEPGSNKHADRSFGTWFTWSYLDFFLVSENMLAEQPSNSGWFANLGSFRTLVGTGEQIEANSQGYLSPQAGLDGFWLGRVLSKEAWIESHIVEAASIAMPRRHRRAKTDSIDGETLIRALMAWKRGEPAFRTNPSSRSG